MFQIRLQSRCGLLACIAVILSASFAHAQSAPAGKACHAQHITPNDANDALNDRKYAEAARLYKEMLVKFPDAVGAKAGLVRSLIGANRMGEAMETANRFAAETPDEALIQDALGQAHFRRGEVDAAQAAFSKALHLDPCYGRTHYDIGRFQTLAGNFLTARKQFDLAHALSPDDRDITGEWSVAHDQYKTLDEQIAMATAMVGDDKMKPESRQFAEGFLKTLQARKKGNCEMVAPTEHAKLKMAPLLAGDQNVFGMGLDVEFDGKRKRLLLDTGASGLVISKAAAASIGLTPEATTRSFGFGDTGAVKTYITHVDKLRIGGLEFHNCEVEVLDHSNNAHDDGLIGPDVFTRWLVTLDTPMREIRLDPLPKRPGDEAAEAVPLRLRTNGIGGFGAEDAGPPHDRYVAPEMESWTRIYRSGHHLIFPTRVNQLPARLFVADTGAFSGMLSPALAKELGNVSEVDTGVSGISGEVSHVYTVDKQVELDFGGVRQQVRGITVIPLGRFMGGTGVEVSGFLGFTALRELTLTIDYRDNLVHVVFDPKHGYHGTGQMTY